MFPAGITKQVIPVKKKPKQKKKSVVYDFDWVINGDVNICWDDPEGKYLEVSSVAQYLVNFTVFSRKVRKRSLVMMQNR